MAWTIWQNEEIVMANSESLDLDFAEHLVPVWFGDVSISFRCILFKASISQEQEKTGRQRYEEKPIYEGNITVIEQFGKNATESCF